MSNRQLPSRVKFLLSDDVRSEANGKITVVGLYADDKIFVQTLPGHPPPVGAVSALNQMVIICLAFDGDGIFPVSATVSAPSGQQLATMSLGQITFSPAGPSTIILQSGLFLVPQFGGYRCAVDIGGISFPFDFQILSGPPTVATGPVVPTTSLPTVVSKKKKFTKAKRTKKGSLSSRSISD